MMKKIVTVLLIVIAGGLKTFAQQKDSLSFDERNKYIYYQVVDLDGTPADTLYSRALNFFKTAYSKSKLELKKSSPSKATIQGDGGFMVYKKAMVATQIDGRIDFNMVVEIKDNRYRFWFTDFVIVPYVRNRYATFEADNGKKTPLEQALRKFGDDALDNYLDKTLENCRSIAHTFTSNMKKSVPAAVSEKKIKKIETKKDW